MTKITPHPFVSTPNNGPCSSCGKLRSNSIHDWDKEPVLKYTLKWSPEDRTFILVRPGKSTIKFGNLVSYGYIKTQCEDDARTDGAELVVDESIPGTAPVPLDSPAFQESAKAKANEASWNNLPDNSTEEEDPERWDGQG